MPRQNRVSPLGELLATPERGLVYGNRGCLHDADGRIRRAYNGRRWIACQLRFRNRRRSQLMVPGRYTELFFLDEATALAAGHRPCAECRNDDYRRFRQIWADVHGESVGADAIDIRLHSERIDPVTRSRRMHAARFDELPDGTMVLVDDRPSLVLGRDLLPWSAAGYGAHAPRPPDATAVVITPPSLVAVLRTGWRSSVPLFHCSARDGEASSSCRS